MLRPAMLAECYPALCGRIANLAGVHDTVVTAQQERRLTLRDRVSVDDALLYVAARWDLIHDFEEHLLDQGAQSTRARPIRERTLRSRFESLCSEDEFYSVQRQELCVLLGEGILGLDEDTHERLLVEWIQADYDGETTDEFGDQSVLQKVI